MASKVTVTLVEFFGAAGQRAYDMRESSPAVRSERMAELCHMGSVLFEMPFERMNHGVWNEFGRLLKLAENRARQAGCQLPSAEECSRPVAGAC